MGKVREVDSQFIGIKIIVVIVEGDNETVE